MSTPRWQTLSIKIWSTTVINENEERFFISESLHSTLTPEMLEDRPDDEAFALMIGEKSYGLQVYDESPSLVSMIFTCTSKMLSPVLQVDASDVKLKCGKDVITRDLSRYDVSWDIIKTGTSTYKVTLAFAKNQTGIING